MQIRWRSPWLSTGLIHGSFVDRIGRNRLHQIPMFRDLAIFNTENVNDDGFGHIARFWLNDLEHHEVAFGDHALEIDLLLWPI